MQHRCCSEGRNNSCYTQWEPLHHFSHMVDITILHSKYVNTYNIFSKGDIIVVSFLQITLIRRSRSNAESFPILTLTDISPMLEDHVPHVLTFPSKYSGILSLSFSMSLWEMQNKTGDKKSILKIHRIRDISRRIFSTTTSICVESHCLDGKIVYSLKNILNSNTFEKFSSIDLLSLALFA